MFKFVDRDVAYQVGFVLIGVHIQQLEAISLSVRCLPKRAIKAQENFIDSAETSVLYCQGLLDRQFWLEEILVVRLQKSKGRCDDAVVSVQDIAILTNDLDWKRISLVELDLMNGFIQLHFACYRRRNK